MLWKTIKHSIKFIIVFWPALGCVQHPKAGQKTQHKRCADHPFDCQNTQQPYQNLLWWPFFKIKKNLFGPLQI